MEPAGTRCACGVLIHNIAVAGIHKPVGKPGGVHLDLGGSPAGANGIWHFHTAVAIIRSIPFNAKIRRDLADDVAGNRGHNLGSVVKDPARSSIMTSTRISGSSAGKMAAKLMALR